MTRTHKLSRLIAWLLATCALSAGYQRIPDTSQSLVGRWQVLEQQNMSIPNTFFWFSMDYVEFRENGQLISLVYWPPDTKQALRLNKIALYTRTSAHTLIVSGACRYQDPCVGEYTLSASGDTLTLRRDVSYLKLRLVSADQRTMPPPIDGPQPSPTLVEGGG